VLTRCSPLKRIFPSFLAAEERERYAVVSEVDRKTFFLEEESGDEQPSAVSRTPAELRLAAKRDHVEIFGLNIRRAIARLIIARPELSKVAA
jgi:hypothetical protein